MAKEKLTQSQIDGVEYRRAKLWQIILVACNALNGMAIYSLIGRPPMRPASALVSPRCWSAVC